MSLVSIAPIPTAFRAYSDVQPFSYRSGATYAQILESMRVWILDDLVPYLNTNISDIQENWDQNVQDIISGINDALNQAITDIANSDVHITDPAVVAALQTTNSLTKAWLTNYLGGLAYVSDTAGLNAVMADAVARQKFVRIKVNAGSTLILDNANTITIDAGYVYVDFNDCTVDATARTTPGVLLSVYGSIVQPYRQTAHGFDNLTLKGPGSTVAGLVGVKFDGVSTTSDHGPSHLQPQHCNVSGFETNVTYGANAYCIDLLNWDIYRGGTGVAMGSGLPTEERITFTNTNIFNNAVGIDAQNSSGDLYMINGSLDYNTDAAIKNGSWQIDLVAVHVESGDKATPDFTLSGNGSRINMFGGSYTNTKSPTWDAPIVNNANNGGGMYIDGTHLGGLGSASGYLATGTGPMRVQNTTGYDITTDPIMSVGTSANLLADPGFDLTSIIDPWQITNDTAALGSTNQLTASNINLSLSTAQKVSGSQSLKITKVNGNGSAAACGLFVRIPRGQRPRVRVRYTKPGTQTGTLFITVNYMTGGNNPATGLFRGFKATQLKQSTIVFTSAAQTWTDFVLTDPTVRTPLWADYISVEFGLNNMTAGDIFVDSVEVTTM